MKLTMTDFVHQAMLPNLSQYAVGIFTMLNQKNQPPESYLIEKVRK